MSFYKIVATEYGIIYPLATRNAERHYRTSKLK